MPATSRKRKMAQDVNIGDITTYGYRVTDVLLLDHEVKITVLDPQSSLSYTYTFNYDALTQVPTDPA